MGTNTKRLKNTLGLQQLAADPVGTIAGESYFNTTTGRARIFDGSTWADQGSSSGGGPAGLDSVTDVVDYDVFDSLSTFAGYTTTGTVALQTVNPLDGTKSASLAPSSSLKKVVSIPSKYRGTKMALRVIIRSTASYGSVTAAFFDETNSVSLGSQTIPTGSVSFIANTTASNAVLTSVTNLTPRVGMQVSGTFIPANTLITAVSPLTLSNQASSTGASQVLRASALSGPQVVQFDIPDNCQSVSWTIATGSETNTETVIDDVMIISVPQIQQAFQQDVDSYLRITGFSPVFGSTATRIISLNNGGVIRQNVGQAIQYLDDAINGMRLVAQKEGLYTFTFSADFNSSAATSSGWTLNATGTQLTSGYTSLPEDIKLASSFDTGGNAISPTCTARAYLKVGDVVRYHNDTINNATGAYSQMTASCEGKLKQVNVASDQKIQLPVSELRFEGASARGSTDTAIVKFDTIAKLVGSAFTVLNTSANGSVAIVQKNGILAVSACNFMSAADNVFISINQSVLTAQPVPSEIANTGRSYSNDRATVAWTGRVKAGDQIRISAGSTPLANNSGNFFNLLHIEDSVQVSVSNTLPQFSENDSEVRVGGGNGTGTTNSTIRRFSNVLQNFGTAITYTDSATLGASFTINEDGEYDITYLDTTANTSANDVNIVLNQTNGAAVGILAANSFQGSPNLPMSCSWSGKLVRGDVIRAYTDFPGNITSASATAKFTICKKGKPNVTGVDVTPFVNIKTDERQVIYGTGIGLGSTSTQSPRYNITKNTNPTILQVIDSTTAGISIRALKKCAVNLTWSGMYSALASAGTHDIYINGIRVASVGQMGSGNARGSLPWNGSLEKDDTITFTLANNTPTNDSTASIGIIAVAEADTVITPVTSFSSDTATFTYAGSGAYTPATLQDSPIGTFITFTYASGGNARTQTNTAPTQSTSDMNANGVRLYTRAFNAASTAAQPACIAVNVGKGFKGFSTSGYVNTGKTNLIKKDRFTQAAEAQGYDADYNETTGILWLDAGFCPNTTTTAVYKRADALTDTNSTDAYITVNASKSPTVVAAKVNDSGAWNPVFTFSGGNGTATFAVSNAYYAKSGKMVTLSCTVAITKGSGSGQLIWAGNPFSSVNTFVFDHVWADGVALSVAAATVMKVVGFGKAGSFILVPTTTETNNTFTAANLPAGTAVLHLCASFITND